MSVEIPTVTRPVTQLRKGEQVLLGVPATTLAQVPTNLSAGAGVLEAARRRHPDRYGLNEESVARNLVVTVEDIQDSDTIVVVTVGAVLFNYDYQPEHMSYDIAVLPTHEVECIRLGC